MKNFNRFVNPRFSTTQLLSTIFFIIKRRGKKHVYTSRLSPALQALIEKTDKTLLYS